MPTLSITGAEVDARLGEIPALVARPNFNPNLLHNWDFRNPVNQRGQVEYILTGYAIDRWIISGSGMLSLRNGYLSLTPSSSSYMHFRQKIENPQTLSDKTVTYSAVLSGQASIIVAIQRSNGAYEFPAEAAYNSTSVGLVTLTYTLPSDLTSLELYVATEAGPPVNLSAIKFEIGTVSTLANDPPMDYGVELAKCQRYQIQLYAGGAGFVGNGYAASATAVDILVPLPTTMRSTPVPQFQGKINIISSSIYYDIIPDAVSIDAMSANNIRMRITRSTMPLIYGASATVYFSSGSSLILDANL